MRFPDTVLFNTTADFPHIVTIRPNIRTDSAEQKLLNVLEDFASLMATLIKEHPDITGIIYYCPVISSTDFYQELFEAAKKESFESSIQKILGLSAIIKTSAKPVVAIIDRRLNSFQLAPMLWAPYIIAKEKIRIGLSDSKLGIFPGLGVTVYSSRSMTTEKAASLLIKSTAFFAEESVTGGLFDQITKDTDEALVKANQWISENTSNTASDKMTPPDENSFEEEIAPVRKKVNQLLPGISPCMELIAMSKKLSLDQALILEAKRYTEVLRNKNALGIMRTIHYGILNAIDPTRISVISGFSFQKISVLGAGMMGSGIAYEAARAGINVCLKDTDKALAIKGKMYTEKCCDKLIQLGKMTESKKVEMLALINPTDKVEDLEASDLIIEAVFEDKELKGNVISESAPFLKNQGVFASNTTSLPITELAAYTTEAENFIGMHFFSPVDRMPLVEIIRGKHTSDETLNKAIQLSLKLQKIPIVVHDSPAFFTSRIFFNYLLEAITLLLEGIPAEIIEQEAVNAGFAVSPLAVLDEISIPLMLHVYDQLPKRSASQKRCYNYLSGLCAAGRTGRKSGKGFYNYDTRTGTKKIWQDLSLRRHTDHVDLQTIQKRLLHVMALDSYRLLEDGVLDQPIDGDIGSILGVGYAMHTGGVFAHIDEIGIQQFVKDCASFNKYGEQWQVPDSLHGLAASDFSFYKGFVSNWPVKK